MSRYGIDYYELSYYGIDNPITFNASPFTALPSNHGQINVSWNTPTGSWSKLLLVRNPYGYPVNPWDGTQVLSLYNGSTFTTPFIDSSLVQGQYYYYSIFLYSLEQYTWISGGTTSALSVKDFGNTQRLYDYLPDIYKINQPYIATTEDWENSDLYSFLSNFGFELDYEQTMTDLLTSRYNVEKVNGILVPTMMNQFGQTYEPAIGLQQNRKLLRDAVTLNKQKGSKEGLIGFIKDFTSYGIPEPVSGTPNPSVNGITVGHNLMLDYNDSSFEEKTPTGKNPGHWLSVDGTADIDQLGTYNILTISVTSSVATITIGAHNYDVGNQVILKGLPYPLFNSSTPVTLTTVDQTAGTLSFSTSSSDFGSRTGYNTSTQSYGILSPAPAAWVEPTALTQFPNKTSGIMAVYNSSTSSQTINAFCGDDAPITSGIPVTAGTTYSFSIYASKGSYTARTVTSKIKWFNRFGVFLSTSSGTGVSDNTATFSSSYRPHVSAAAPTGAAYACPGISIASVAGSGTYEHHYFDAAQFEAASSPTAFDEARQLHITLRANRINELINPNFSVATSPWTATGSSTSIVGTYSEPNGEVLTISSASVSTDVATVNTSLPHSYQVGSTVYISGVTGSSASSYNGARVVTSVTLNSFTYSVTASNSSVTSGYVYAQSESLKLTATATGTTTLKSWDGSTTSELMGIYYPGTSYTFSIYAQPQTASETLTAKISWYDTTNTLISTSTGTATVCPQYIWSRPYVTASAPATAAYAAVEVDWTTAATSDVLIVDEALFENSGLVNQYFDGFTGPGDLYDLMWEGGNSYENAARSHLYKNRFSVQSRLYGATLSAQSTLGTTIAIYLAQPQT